MNIEAFLKSMTFYFILALVIIPIIVYFSGGNSNVFLQRQDGIVIGGILSIFLPKTIGKK